MIGILRLFDLRTAKLSEVRVDQENKPPLLYLEKKRLEAQRNYRIDQEYLKKNEESIKKWLEEQQEANLKALGSSSLFGAFTGWGKPHPPPNENMTPSSPNESGAVSTGEKR